MMKIYYLIIFLLPSSLWAEDAMKNLQCKMGDSKIDDGGEFPLFLYNILTSLVSLVPGTVCGPLRRCCLWRRSSGPEAFCEGGWGDLWLWWGRYFSLQDFLPTNNFLYTQGWLRVEDRCHQEFSSELCPDNKILNLGSLTKRRQRLKEGEKYNCQRNPCETDSLLPHR